MMSIEQCCGCRRREGGNQVQLEVKDRDGKTFSMKLDSQTLVYQDKDKSTVAEVKAGRTVVDAIGDSEEDLLAVEVRIVPAIAR
jgi:hypothetical protein